MQTNSVPDSEDEIGSGLQGIQIRNTRHSKLDVNFKKWNIFRIKKSCSDSDPECKKPDR